MKKKIVFIILFFSQLYAIEFNIKNDLEFRINSYLGVEYNKSKVKKKRFSFIDNYRFNVFYNGHIKNHFLFLDILAKQNFQDSELNLNGFSYYYNLENISIGYEYKEFDLGGHSKIDSISFRNPNYDRDVIFSQNFNGLDFNYKLSKNNFGVKIGFNNITTALIVFNYKFQEKFIDYDFLYFYNGRDEIFNQENHNFVNKIKFNYKNIIFINLINSNRIICKSYFGSSFWIYDFFGEIKQKLPYYFFALSNFKFKNLENSKLNYDKEFSYSFALSYEYFRFKTIFSYFNENIYEKETEKYMFVNKYKINKYMIIALDYILYYPEYGERYYEFGLEISVDII